MSTDFTIYTNGEPAEIRELVEGALRLTLRSGNVDTIDVFYGELLNVAITFAIQHGMVDDMGIPFSTYPVSIEFARSGAQSDPELRSDLCRVLALLLGRTIHRRLGAETMVVRDSQELIETA